MAITYTTANSSGTSALPSITHGLTIDEGDLVLVSLHLNDDEPMVDSGGFTVDKRNVWVDVGGGNFSAQVFLMTKVAGASEPTTYTFDMGGISDRYSIALYAIKGADTASIYDGAIPTLTELASTSSPTVPSVTTTNDNSLVIAGLYYDSANAHTFSAPTNGFTEDFDLSGSQSQAAFSKIQATAGAVGDVSVTASNSVVHATWMFAINEASASATITDIDGDNNVQVGQTGAIITTTGIDAASVTQSVTLGGETLTITNWATDAITVAIPASIGLKWGRTDLQLAVTHDGGTTTLDNVTLSAPAGWETVTFTTAPDEASTESFYEHAKTDATLGGGGYTMVAGDVLAWTTSTGLTIDGQTIPTVSPAATVTGSYKIWDDTLSTWSSTSTYTITDQGTFVPSESNDMAIVQPLVKSLVSTLVH